jgi:hypothetical protein
LNPRLRIREGCLFYSSGVKTNVSLSSLNGWTCCYKKPYSDSTSENSFEKCIGKRILVGGRHINSNKLG